MADKGGTATGCSICEYIKNLTPDRVLWEDEYWLGGALLDVPGWIMVMTKRHVEGIWSLNDAEAARFGPMMRDITGVIKDITGAERVHYAAMRSEEHTSELQSLMRISYAVFCLKKK